MKQKHLFSKGAKWRKCLAYVKHLLSMSWTGSQPLGIVSVSGRSNASFSGRLRDAAETQGVSQNSVSQVFCKSRVSPVMVAGLTALLMMFTIGVGNVWGETITLNKSALTQLASNNYSSGATKTDDVGNVTFEYKDLCYNGANIQAKASSGVIYNKTLIPGKITNVAITHSGTARATTMYMGTSSSDISTQVANGKGSLSGDAPSNTCPGWFKITRGANAAQWSQVVITYTPATITLSKNSITGLDYNVSSGPSAAQTFTVSGSNIPANLVVTAPTNFEVSLNGSSWASTQTISVTLTGSASAGTLSATTVYVRLASGKSAGNYSGNVEIAMNGCKTISNVNPKTVAVSGTVSAAPSTYTVDFNCHGCSGGNPSSITQNAGTSFTLPSPTKTGYTCSGWYTAETGGTKRANAGGSYTPTVSETLHAQWACANPTSLSISETNSKGDFCAGESMTLTVSGTGIASDATYQWSLNGSTIANAISSSYTVNSLAKENAGSYTCTVSNGSCSATSSNYNIKVWTFYSNVSGSWAHADLTYSSTGKGTITFNNLPASTTYAFKLNNNTSSGNWFGNTGTMTGTVTEANAWDFHSNVDANCQFTTGMGGTYVFTVNYSSSGVPTVSVTYPTANQAAGLNIYFDNSTTNWDPLKYRIGKSDHNQATDMTLVSGTDKFYKITTTTYNNMTAWQIANNQAWTGSNDIKQWRHDQATDITEAIPFQEYTVVSDFTILPTTGTYNSTDQVTWWAFNQSNGMLTHTATISSYSSTMGTVTVSYTNTSNAAASFTSGNQSLAHRCILTITAVANTGYNLASLQVNGSDFTSGSTHILAADATITATFAANTNTAYTVKHYKQNLDNTYPSSPTETDNLTGTTGASVTPDRKSYTGFTAPAGQTVTILADGSREVTYQYTRNSYNLTWSTDGDALTGDYTTGSTKFEATITPPNTPTKPGYNFAGWSSEPAATMPAANTTYTATWTAKTDTYKTGLHTSASGWTAYASGYTTGTSGAGYTIPNPGSVAKGDGSGCEDTHYYFAGWVSDTNKEAGTIEGNVIPASGTTDATGTTYWAVWYKESAGGGTSTSTLSNSSVISSGNSQGYKTYCSSECDKSPIDGWTGKYAVNYVSTGPHYSIQLGRNTNSGNGAYNSHLTSPVFAGSATHISITLSTSVSQTTGNGRKFYLMDNDNLNYTAASDQTSSYGIGTYNNENSNYEVSFDITNSPTQFHIYADGTAYIKTITVTYSTVAYDANDPKVVCEACAADPVMTNAASALKGDFSLTSVGVTATGWNPGTNCSWDEKGFVWGSSANPTVSNNKVIVATGTDATWDGALVPSGSTDPTSLSVGTTYHFRAYGKNGKDAAAYVYSADVSFTPRSVTCGSVTGGTISAGTEVSAAGKTITLTATPANSHFTFNSWTVTNKSTSATITVTNNQFTMPDADVEITASFDEDAHATVNFYNAKNGNTPVSSIHVYEDEKPTPPTLTDGTSGDACDATSDKHYGWTRALITGTVATQAQLDDRTGNEVVYAKGSNLPAIAVGDLGTTINYYAVWAVRSGSGGSTVTDELTYTSFFSACTSSGSNTNGAYTDFADKGGSESDAVYAGKLFKHGNGPANCKDYIQMKTDGNNIGLITTTTGGTAKKVTVDWNSAMTTSRTINVYGKSSAYSAASDLYNEDDDGDLLGTITWASQNPGTQLTITGDYSHIGIRSSSGAIYLNSIDIDWSTGSGYTYSNFLTTCCDNLVTLSATGTNCTASVESSHPTCSETATDRDVVLSVAPTAGYEITASSQVTYTDNSASGHYATAVYQSGPTWNSTTEKYEFVYRFNQNEDGTGAFAVTCSPKTYTIYFDQSTATTAGTSSVDVVFNGALPAIAELPEKTDYNFAGYFTQEVGGTQFVGSTGTWYTVPNWINNSKQWIKADNKTLYPHWEEKTLVNYRTNCPSFDVYNQDGTSEPDIHLTSTKDVAVYSTSAAGNLIRIIASGLDAYGNHPKIGVEYYDANNEDALVTGTDRVFRLCSSSTYNTENDLLDLGENTTEYDQTFSISYTPKDYGQSHHYKLKLILRNNNTEKDNITIHLYGRSLPKEFVIAAKNEETWYALPNTLAATEGAQGAITPIVIDVDNSSAPTKAVNPAGTVIYGACNKYTNDNRSGLRFTSDGAHWTQTSTTTGTYKIWLSSTGGTNVQDWYLKSSDLSAYEVFMDPIGSPSDKRRVELYNYEGVKMGYHNTGSTDARTGIGNIYLLPVEFPSMEANIMEWGTDHVVIDLRTPGTSTKVKTQVGGGAIGSEQSLESMRKDVGVYRVAVSLSSSDALKDLKLYFYNSSDVLQGVAEFTIPRIVSSSTTTESFGTAFKKDAPFVDLIILDGATLTVSETNPGTKFTFRDLYIYGGGKMVVPTGTYIDFSNVYMRGGHLNAAWVYQYSHPQMVLNGTLTNASNTINYDYLTNNSQFYSLALPYNVTLSGIVNPDFNNKQSWLIHGYDGALRASGSQVSGWYDVEEGSTEGGIDPLGPTDALTAGMGYTFFGAMQKVNGIRQKWSVNRFPMTLTSGEPEEAKAGVTVTAHGMTETPAESGTYVRNDGVAPNDACWNMVGNPYLADIEPSNDLMTSVSATILSYQNEKTLDDNDNWTGGWHWVENATNVRYVRIPNNTGTEYEQYRFNDPELKLKAFHHFFIQAGKTGTFSIALTSRAQAAPAIRRSGSIMLPSEMDVDFLLTRGSTKTNFGLTINNDFSTSFVIGEDMPEDLDGTNIKAYTLIDEATRVTYNGLPVVAAEQMIPVGYRAEVTGEYTFSYKADSNADYIEYIWLTDKAKGDVTNLKENTYTFETESGVNDDRFALNIVFKSTNTTTDLESIFDTNNGPQKFIYHDMLYIMNEGVIYDVTGKRVKEINK